MTYSKRLIKHSSHYLTGQLLLTAAGLISFPILTRVLTVSEYGILSLINSILLVTVAAGKFGLQHSAVRFYGEFETQKRQDPISQFYTTLLFFPMLFGAIIALIFTFVFQVISVSWLEPTTKTLIVFATIAIPLQCTTGPFVEFLRAEQNTKLYNIFIVVHRYFSLAFSLFLLFYLIKGLYGFFSGMIMVEIITVIFIFFILKNSNKLNINRISFNFFKETLKYGFPLFIYEVAVDILNYGDRFLIQYYMGSESLGIYSVGYNMVTYIYSGIILPLRLAIFPIYLEIWNKEGSKATKEFLGRALTYSLMIIIPIIFGICAVGKDLIVFLASEKFIQSYYIIPFIVTGMMIYGTYNISGAGLFIYKKTRILTVLILASALLNIILNMVLIPKLGIVGAAIATLVAYLLLTLLINLFSFKYLKFTINITSILHFIIASLIMFIAISQIRFSSNTLNLAAKIISGITIYSMLVLIMNTEIRRRFVRIFNKHPLSENIK